MFKRAISPVVSAVLLITVAVVAIVTFQLFYDNFSSSVFSDVEVGSGTLGANSVETIVDDSLYIKTGEDNLTIIRVELDGNDCDAAGVYGTGVVEINISSCIDNVTSEITTVVVVTSTGIISERIFLPNFLVSNSTSLTPPIGETFSFLWNYTLFQPTGYSPMGDSLTTDGSNIYFAGSFFSDPFLLSIDSSGNMNWNSSTNPSIDFADIDYATSNLYVAGWNTSSALIFKYDTLGNHIWNYSYDAGTTERGYSVAGDSIGNVYALVAYDVFGTPELQVHKLDSFGNQLWNWTYSSGLLNLYNMQIEVDGNNDIIIGVRDGSDVFLAKISSFGVHQWNFSLDVAGGSDSLGGIAVDSSNNIIISSGDWSIPVTLSKFDSSGSLLWNYNYSSNYGGPAGVAVDSSGNVYASPYYDPFDVHWDIIKVDSAGNYIGNFTQFHTNWDYHYADIEIDSSNNVIIGGNTDQTSGRLLSISKYSQP